MSVNILKLNENGERVLVPVSGRISSGNQVLDENVLSLEDIIAATSFDAKDVPNAEAVKELNSRVSDFPTTPQVVGKWIDGRDVYRLTVQATLPTPSVDGNPVRTEVATLDDYDICVSLRGAFSSTISSNKSVLAMPHAAPVNNINSNVYCGLDASKKLFVSNNLILFGGRTAIFVIEYVK